MTLVLDIGGSYIRYEIIEAGEMGRVESNQITLEAFLDSFISSFGIKRVGISIAGEVRDGYVLSAPNINLRHKNLSEYIKRRWGVDVAVENDLNMASLAEAKYWGVDNLVALYSGTGLGAGIVLSGEILRGANLVAGEIGHTPYKDAPFQCGCGRDNCFENWASGVGLKKWAEHYNLDRYLLRELREIENKNIVAEYEEGLLRACGTVVTLFNPSVLALGGGIVEDNRYLVDLVRDNISKFATNSSTKNLKIEMTKLYDAPLEGIKIALGAR